MTMTWLSLNRNLSKSNWMFSGESIRWDVTALSHQSGISRAQSTNTWARPNVATVKISLGLRENRRITNIELKGRLQELHSGKLKDICGKNRLIIDGGHNESSSISISNWIKQQQQDGQRLEEMQVKDEGGQKEMEEAQG